jgi:hypothetical protein
MLLDMPIKACSIHLAIGNTAIDVAAGSHLQSCHMLGAAVRAPMHGDCGYSSCTCCKATADHLNPELYCNDIILSFDSLWCTIAGGRRRMKAIW